MSRRATPLACDDAWDDACEVAGGVHRRAGRMAAVARMVMAGGLFVMLAACGATDGKTTDSTGAVASVTADDDRVELGAPAPSYSAVSLEGDSVSLAGERGKVVLLNIWATWCHPCRTEIPELRAMYSQYQSRGLTLVGVSVDADGNDDTIRRFMNDYEMTFPIWRDPDERVLSRFRTIGVPATFLIDREGVLRWRKTGPIAPNDTALSAAIERALGG